MSKMHRLCLGVTMTCSVLSCNSDAGAGPDPLKPQYYQLQFFDWNSLPKVLMRGLFATDYSELESATLVPYAVGRTIDQRFFGDRTGRGTPGGNTRDTTIARGQFMDIRVVRHVTGSLGTITWQRDSSIVDVEMRDTVVIISRPHAAPRYSQVDTGYFASGMLVVPTVIRLMFGAPFGPRGAVLAYTISRQ